MNYVLGLDLGGTKISCGIVSEEGKILDKPITIPTEANKSKEQIIKNFRRCVDRVLHIHSSIPISGIGIGSPGPLDTEKGIILNPGNLPTLHGCNLKREIEKRYSFPVRIDNDANCFVLGEALFGAGNGFSVVTGLTLGTGLGCGIVVDGKIYRGVTGTAAEIWKTPYLDGDFEDKVSGRGIEGAYIRRAGSLISTKEIAGKARCGEKIAIESLEEFGQYLGIMISFIVNLLDPNVVVLGDSAGIVGAASLFFEDL